MNKTVFALAGALACAVSVHAKTVLWYHFDEESPGTPTTAAEPTILNAVDNTKFAGTPWTMSKGGFDWNKTPSFGTVAGFMPTYTNAFGGGMSWFDPVSGEHSKDKTSMNFVRQYRNCTGGANGVGQRSTVVVADPNDELKLQSFTVEFFIKFNPENAEPPPGSSIADGEATTHIISMYGDGTDLDYSPWSLWAEPSGELDFRAGWNGTRFYATCYPNGSPNWANPNWRMHALKDGRWHHVAMTVDGADPSAVILKTYVDYLNEKTYTLNAPITYPSGASLTIGGTTNHINMALNADIDEVRISDVALTADQFLHPYSMDADDDTLTYLSFNNWFGNINDLAYYTEGQWYRKFTDTYLNEAGQAGALYCPIILHQQYGIPEFVEAPADKSLWNIASAVVPDLNAYHFTVNDAYSLSSAIQLPNPCQFTCKGGLTVEGYFKMEQPASSVATTWLVYAPCNGASWELSIDMSTYKLNVCKDWGGFLSTTALSDHEWHHIAAVSDEANNEVRLYVDHALVGTKSGVTLPHEPYASAADIKPMRLGDLQNTTGIGAYNGSIDEFRVTLRPLEPQEFLTTRTPTSEVLASASFENNLLEGPSDYTDLFAAGVLAGSGDYAVSRPFKSETNKRSIRLDKATVTLGRNIMLEKDGEFTLEFFLRPNTLTEQANIVALKKAGPSDANIWSVSLSADKSTLTVEAGGTSANFTLPTMDDWWQHFGLVFSKSDNLPVVTLYVNHAQVGEAQAMSAAMDYSALSKGVVIGSPALTGWFDELRITRGVLAPEAMMARGTPTGFVLWLK